MAPKKQVKEEGLVIRPPSENDHKIVATIRGIQELVDREYKWRNRAHSASHTGQVAALKVQKINALVEQCKIGMALLRNNFDEFANSVGLLSPSAQPITVQNGQVIRVLPAAATAAPPKGPKPSGSDEAADGQQKRSEQQQLLVTILKAMFDQPRLSREKPPPTPSSGAEMLKEFDLVAKFCGQYVSSEPKQKQSGQKPPVGSRGVIKQQSSTLEIPILTPLQEYIGDLPVADFFPLSCPRAVDPVLVQYVSLLRSKRLRLEHSLSLFCGELSPLGERVKCSSMMGTLSSYGAEAVVPQIQKLYAQELELQKIRNEEDQAFLGSRAQTAPAPRK
jgi:hypothetical protein